MYANGRIGNISGAARTIFLFHSLSASNQSKRADLIKDEYATFLQRIECLHNM